jgi:hypothetical protein
MIGAVSPRAAAGAVLDALPYGSGRMDPKQRNRLGATAGALWPLVGLATLVAAVEGGWPVPLRLGLTIAVVSVAPGAAVVGLLGLRPSPARVVLTLGTSLAIAVLVAEALLLAGHLRATAVVWGLVIVTAPFVVAGLVSSRPRPSWLPALRAIGPVPSRPAALTVLAALLWVVALTQVNPSRAGQVGIISVLPVTWWLGVVVLTVAFVHHVRDEVHPVLAATQVAVLVAFLFVTLTVREPYARIPTSYTHVGLVDYLVRDHRIVDHFDARFSWPGSLAIGAALTQLAGLASSVSFVRWAIPAMVALWAVAVYAVVTCFSSSRRAAWTAVWLFILLNWVGQDYWSPQALNFFLTLAVVVAAATWLPRRVFRARNRWLPFEQPRDAVADPLQAVGVVCCITVIVAAIASSHQLSPFVVLGSLVVLWLADRRDVRLLPVLALLLTFAWISWGAYDYWIGHFDRLTRDVGQVSGVVAAGTSSRLSGSSAARQLVLATRLGLSCGAWLAAMGAWWFLRKRNPAAATIGALAVMPFGAVALQSYGGELGLRIFLFGLPFIALLLAEGAALVRERWRPPPVVAIVALVALVVPFVIARYGNEQFEQTYREDMAAVEALYAMAPRGSVVLSANTANAFRRGPYRDYRFYRQPLLVDPDRLDVRQALAAARQPRGYVLLTRAGANQAVLVQGARTDWDRALAAKLRDFGAVERFRSGRAAVYEYELDLDGAAS